MCLLSLMKHTFCYFIVFLHSAPRYSRLRSFSHLSAYNDERGLILFYCLPDSRDIIEKKRGDSTFLENAAAQGYTSPTPNFPGNNEDYCILQAAIFVRSVCARAKLAKIYKRHLGKCNAISLGVRSF